MVQVMACVDFAVAPAQTERVGKELSLTTSGLGRRQAAAGADRFVPQHHVLTRMQRRAGRQCAKKSTFSCGLK